MRLIQAGSSVAVLTMVIACSSTRMPTRPSTPTPDPSGAWVGEATLTDFDGGECLAETFHDIAGLPGQFHANLTQDGVRVTATMDIDHTGAQCRFDGTLDGTELMLTASSCTGAKTLAVPCGNGAVRGLLPGAERLQATIGVGRVDGRAIESDNVVISGTQTRVGQFTGRSAFVLLRP
jgi:hypothetical protein